MPAPRGTPWVDPELPPGAVSVRVLLRHEAHHGSARSDWDRLAGAVGAHARAETAARANYGHRPGASARQGGGSLSRPVPEVVLLAPEVSAPTGGDAL